MHTFLVVITVFFWSIFIVGPFVVPKGPFDLNILVDELKFGFRSIIRTMIMLTSFSMWLFWSSVYIAQMNPLVPPMMSNNTVGWVAERWGVKPW